MKRAIILSLLMVLGTLPLQGTAQANIPAVELTCGDSSNNYLDGPGYDDNGNWSDGYSDSVVVWIDSFDPLRTNDTFSCIAKNPNNYVERVQIIIDADGLVVDGPYDLVIDPNNETWFQVNVSADQGMTPSIRTITITALVVEANGVPPPNYAEAQVVGDVYISTDYKYGGCYTPDAWRIPGTVMDSDWRFVSLDIFIGTGENNSTGELLGYNANVTIELNHTAAPLHSENFALLAWMGCYDDVPFHRVIEGFMNQGGDFQREDGSGGNAATWYGYCNGESTLFPTCEHHQFTLPDETDNGLLHLPGAISMAKTSAPHTGGSQFFMIPSNSSPDWLDGVHTVFGSVIDGMEHVDAINQVETGGGQGIAPVFEVKIVSANLWDESDSDGDGTPDDSDDFPDDANETSDSDGDGVGDNSDAFPNDANETHDDDGDGVGNNTDAFPNDANETHDDDSDGVGNNSDAFPQDPDETHDDDGDGVGNNTDVFPDDPDEQFDNDDDGVGNNADDFPDNALASNWATVYAAVGVLVLLLIGAGVMISRMKKGDELPNVPGNNELAQLDKQIEELQKKKSEIISQDDLMFAEQTASMYDSPAPIQASPRGPPPGHRGEMKDGCEVAEYPVGSDAWWWKDQSTGKWNEWT